MSYKRVYLELSNRCNLNCTICYRRTWSEKPNDMKESVIEKIYDEIKTKEVEVILGGIGEPTISPHFSKAVDLFKDHHLTVTTNATLLDERLRHLIVGRVNKLVVSIDGLDEKFKEIRGSDVNHIIDNLKLLNALKLEKSTEFPRLIIEFVASKYNIDNIYKVMDLASELKATTIIISNLIPQDQESSKEILYTRYENKAVKELLNTIRTHSFRKGINAVLPNVELKTERRCSYIDSESVVISSEGDITPCYRFLHDTTEYVFGRKKEIKKFSFGNIKDNAISDLYNSTEYTNFRNRVYNNQYPSCMDCDLVDGCDTAKTSETDCYTIAPSCADCIWNRKFSICP